MNTDYTDNLTPKLTPLKLLNDFKVAKNNLDIRGWEVFGADGLRLGTVDDLIIDETLMKVRYLDVDIDTKLIHNNPDHHLLVPIGSARLQQDDSKVFVNHLDQMTLPRYPLFKGGAVVPEYERLLRETMMNPTQTPMSTGQPAQPIQKDFYQHEHFDDTKFYEKAPMANPVHQDLEAIERLIQMRNSGALTEEEFQVLKRRAIGI